MVASLHLHGLLEFRFLLFYQPVVVVPKVTRLLPQLGHLGLRTAGDRPDVLALPLMSLAVFLNTLLDLTLVQAVRPSLSGRSWGWLGGRGRGGGGGSTGVGHVCVAVGGGGELKLIGGSLALFDDVLDLDDDLRVQIPLPLKTLQDL